MFNIYDFDDSSALLIYDENKASNQPTWSFDSRKARTVPGMMPLTPPPSILRMVISSSSDPFTNIVLPTFF
jgi:hypothetical protein